MYFHEMADQLAILRDATGPYDATAYGTCADGHPVNAMGRCEPLNLTDYPSAPDALITIRAALQLGTRKATPDA